MGNCHSRFTVLEAKKIFVYRYITGGGGALYVVLTKLEERLLHVLGNVNVNGFKNVIELGLCERKTKLKKKISIEIGYKCKQRNRHKYRLTKKTKRS
ncbi:hypothetical protein TcasGA2_TC031692 [Tribolium castaneum]|uniref:Uncharacterized protein n=1 Tax=Tribolium castaneum TaxID=7070 RepID=A0A139W8Q9_TRICA|nr:hypothetical protein TcasGA2_TC031692 [Tribolium castaneum]